MAITASALRNNVYRLLDRVAEGGGPLTIKRRGRLLKIICTDRPTKLSQLSRHDCIKGDPDDLVHIDWSKEWRHDLP